VLPQKVRELVTYYLDTVDSARSGLADALYLAGSVALGDYQPPVSDGDFIAVRGKPDRTRKVVSPVRGVYQR
jgi:hypothetical protein